MNAAPVTVRRHRTDSVAVGVAAAVAYLILVPPVTGDKDGAELALVLVTNGVAHPTGYPLFTLLGHGFVVALHALGCGWAWSANAWSAVGGGVAVGLLHRLGVALISPAVRRRDQFLLGLLPVVLFGWNPIWTVEATIAEVYSWHVAWVAGACLLALALSRRWSAGEQPVVREALAWGLICGVGLAHHLTSLGVLAPLSLALLWRRRLHPRLVIVAVVATALPLVSYGVIAWRAAHPGLVQWPILEAGWRGFRAHITGSQYWTLVGHFRPSAVQEGLLGLYVYPFLGVAVAVLTIMALRGREAAARPIHFALLATAALQTISAFRYGVADPSSYFLTPMALGLAALPAVLAGGFAGGRQVRRVALGATGVAVIAAVGLSVPWTRTAVERRAAYLVYDANLREMWAAIPVQRGFVCWTDDAVMHLRQYQLLDGDKVGLEVVQPFILAHPGPRARFRARYGIDPLAGITLPTNRQLFAAGGPMLLAHLADDIVHSINRQTDLPVIVFDPMVPSVRMLNKPGANQPGKP